MTTIAAPREWIGVDLDGTLARLDEWQGETHIGPPIPRMVERVKRMLAAGEDVRIVTARAYIPSSNVISAIQKWCLTHIGVVLPITASKNYWMKCLYDDRVVQVEFNTGRLIGVPDDE